MLPRKAREGLGVKQGYGSAVEHMLSMCKAFEFISSTKKRERERELVRAMRHHSTWPCHFDHSLVPTEWKDGSVDSGLLAVIGQGHCCSFPGGLWNL